MKLILLVPVLLLSACAGGVYRGPSLNLSAGFNGISVGVGIVGPAPIIASAVLSSSSQSIAVVEK